MSEFLTDRVYATNLSDQELKTIFVLKAATWPSALTEDDTVEKFIQLKRAQNQTRDQVQVSRTYHNQQLIAHAELFKVPIQIDEHVQEVWALAGVCVAKQFRGQNWGARVVQEVFDVVDADELPLCLFQTTVSGFYHKLGARSIEGLNQWQGEASNLCTTESPWWNEQIMIYPAAADWPEGATIDLLGPAW